MITDDDIAKYRDMGRVVYGFTCLVVLLFVLLVPWTRGAVEYALDITQWIHNAG